MKPLLDRTGLSDPKHAEFEHVPFMWAWNDYNAPTMIAYTTQDEVNAENMSSNVYRGLEALGVSVAIIIAAHLSPGEVAIIISDK